MSERSREAELERVVRLAARQFNAWAFVTTSGTTVTSARNGEAFPPERVARLPSHEPLERTVAVLSTGDPDIGFLACSPVFDEAGAAVGAFGIATLAPRDAFSAEDMRTLEDYAALAGAAHARLRPPPPPQTLFADIFQEVFCDLSAAVGIYDTQMRVLAVSRGLRALTQMGDGPVRGRTIYDVIPHLPPHWRKDHQRCLAGEPLRISVDHLPARDGGGTTPVARRLRPWHNADGSVGGLVNELEPLDESGGLMADLERSRLFAATVVDTIEEGIVACDAEGRVLTVNAALRRILRLRPEEVEGARWPLAVPLYRFFSNIPLADRDMPLSRALRGEYVREHLVIRPPGGEPRPVAVSAAPMRDENGNTLGAVASLRDLTKEHMALAAIRNAKARYRAIFDHASHFFALLKPDGTVVTVNETAASAAGAVRSTLVGRRLHVLHALSDGSEARRLRAAIRTAASGLQVRYETRMKTVSGRYVPVDCTLTPVLDRGVVVNIIAEGLDISDKHAKQTTLLNQRAELQLVLDNVPMRILVKDDDNRVLRCNRAAAAAFGRGMSEVEGHRLEDIDPEHAAAEREEDAAVFAADEPRRGVPTSDPSDPSRWIRSDKVPYTSATGQRYIFHVVTDVTDELKIQQALRESERLHRILYNRTPVMLHSIDGDGRLTNVSDYWVKKLGFRREEVLGRRFVDFMTAESREKALAETPGRGHGEEYTLVCRDGTVLDILMVHFAEEDDEGNVSRSLVALTDVTELKRTEAQLVRAQRMETIGQLTGGLAHDFNNILCVILGNLQLIERFVRNNEVAVRRLEAAIKAAESGANLTRRLLSLARRQPLEHEVLDLPRLIEGTLPLLQRAVGEQVTVLTDLGDEPLLVRTDAALFESALLNLAVNARDAMPDGGTLTIGCHLVAVHGDEAGLDPAIAAGTYVRVAATDTGTGIPDDLKARVFEPFFTSKEGGQSSGLGLSMVHGFMQQSTGHVQLESEVGKGTTVALLFPAQGGQSVAPRPEPLAQPARQRVTARILVVEDQPEVRTVLRETLLDLGYTTLEASSGAEAEEILARGERVDLLLTDVVMPGAVGGIELARRVAVRWPELPMLLISGNLDARVLDEDRPQRLHLIRKPFRRDDIAAKLAEALGKRRRG